VERKVRRARLALTETLYLGNHPIPVAVLLASLGPARFPSLVFRGPEMIVGRDRGCGLVVDQAIAAARHGRLTPAGGEVRSAARGTPNGTFVNGRKVEGPIVVKAGDRIRLGTAEFALVLGDTSAPSPVPVPVPREPGPSVKTEPLAPPPPEVLRAPPRGR